MKIYLKAIMIVGLLAQSCNLFAASGVTDEIEERSGSMRALVPGVLVDQNHEYSCTRGVLLVHGLYRGSGRAEIGEAHSSTGHIISLSSKDVKIELINPQSMSDVPGGIRGTLRDFSGMMEMDATQLTFKRYGLALVLQEDFVKRCRVQGFNNLTLKGSALLYDLGNHEDNKYKGLWKDFSVVVTL